MIITECWVTCIGRQMLVSYKIYTNNILVSSKSYCNELLFVKLISDFSGVTIAFQDILFLLFLFFFIHFGVVKGFWVSFTKQKLLMVTS